MIRRLRTIRDRRRAVRKEAAALVAAHGDDACPNVPWFSSMGGARARIDAWRIDDNQNRPRSALSGLTPGRVR